MMLKDTFFQDLAAHLQMWRDDAVGAVADPGTAKNWAESISAIERLHHRLQTPEALEDLRTFLDEILRGILHSSLVTIDGGTAASEAGNLALIEAESGSRLTDGSLHEEFFTYLADHDLI